MRNRKKSKLISACFIALLPAAGVFESASAVTYGASDVVPPKPNREFRAAWVATVLNIDWPSRPGLSAAQQKSELIGILNRAVQLKLNAIVLQVRPACDAFYASPIEPWSEYLTGQMGKPPSPYYDPLEFAVEEAHQRGLELHAWFNPYRARDSSATSPSSINHISRTRPELVKPYGKYLWLDPGEKEVQDHSLNVVMDVAKRYDIDGVHFDDYFYPYKQKDASGNDLDFPDGNSWKRFGAGGKKSRSDWRRENVDLFIQRVYQSIKSTKPWVKFGISPFGVWRPMHPPQIRGKDAYSELYADARKWLANGWVDYMAPQLYWAIQPPEQSYPVLLKWWTEQNSKGRHIWPGLDATKVGRTWSADEIVNQIRLTRKCTGASGEVFWNMKSLMVDRGHLAEMLQKEVYAQPALVPASAWLDAQPPAKPRLTVRSSSSSPSRVSLSWQASGPEKASRWVLQTRIGNQWKTEVMPANATSRTLDGDHPEIISLTAVDRTGNASPPSVLKSRRK